MSAEETTEAPEPRPCGVCRGTGQVVSNLGGTPSRVPCPWCEGTGAFLPGHDAQAARREGAAAGDAGAPGEPRPARPTA